MRAFSREVRFSREFSHERLGLARVFSREYGSHESFSREGIGLTRVFSRELCHEWVTDNIL